MGFSSFALLPKDTVVAFVGFYCWIVMVGADRGWRMVVSLFSSAGTSHRTLKCSTREFTCLSPSVPLP